jgi:hypothetical protein
MVAVVRLSSSKRCSASLMVIQDLFWRMNKELMRGNCKNQTKAPKRSVCRLKRAFDARLRGALPDFAGTFEPKWVGI